LSDKEKKEAEQTKVKGSKNGEQHITYTKAVKKAFEEVKNESHKKPTREDLYKQAQKLNIAGRSKMSKSALQKAIDKAK
jgi:phage gp16-like protein